MRNKKTCELCGIVFDSYAGFFAGKNELKPKYCNDCYLKLKILNQETRKKAYESMNKSETSPCKTTFLYSKCLCTKFDDTNVTIASKHPEKNYNGYPLTNINYTKSVKTLESLKKHWERRTDIHKIVHNKYFLECYLDTRNTPAWYIKTYEDNYEQRQSAVNHYTELLTKIFKETPTPTNNIVATYIPSSITNVFSNCGKVVRALAHNTSWLEDGTSKIVRNKTIDSVHENPNERSNPIRQKESLGISSDFAGKDVILFDDRLTSGQSANQVIELLYDKGARNVCFIALAITNHKIVIYKSETGNILSGYLTFNGTVYNFIFDPPKRGKNGTYVYARLYHNRDSVRIIKTHTNDYFGYVTINDKQYHIKNIEKQNSNQISFIGNIIINDSCSNGLNPQSEEKNV